MIADLRQTRVHSLARTLNKQIFSTSNMQIPLQLRDLSIPPYFIPRQLQTQPHETVHITEEMIHKKLQSLGADKSPVPDKLHPRILKELAKELATPLAIIYNKCM